MRPLRARNSLAGLVTVLWLATVGSHAGAETVVIRDIDAQKNAPNIVVRADVVDDSSTHMYIPGIRPEEFKLQFFAKRGDADPIKLNKKDKEPYTAIGTEVKAVSEANMETAMLILVEGAQAFIGNSDYILKEDPEATPFKGALEGAKKAAVALADTVKNGVVGVHFYGDKVIEVIPMGAPGAVRDIEVVTQSQFKNVNKRAFFLGIDDAIAALNRTNKPRKILVVISDGSDGMGTGEKIDSYTDKIRNSRIEVYAIQYTAPEFKEATKDGNKNMSELGEFGMYKKTENPDQIEQFATRSLKEQISQQYIITFEAKDAPWSKDKSKPELRAVKVFGKDAQSDKTEALFGYYKKPGKKGAIWPWIVFPLAGILLIVVVVMIIKGRGGAEEPVAPPLPIAPPVAAAPAPAPAKTVMLGMGGGGDDYPMVGWIVAVAGPQQGQTFKLQQGRTTVGTGTDQNIVVMDPFMSTRHAEILCTPMGFQLIDVGSTNGSFVNSKRIKSHDLVDNDSFTLGKTDFKFKSIN